MGASDFHLSELRVTFESLKGEFGHTEWDSDHRLITLDDMIVFDKEQELHTLLHETLHLMRGDYFGRSSNFFRKLKDWFWFGASDESQYDYSLYGLVRNVSRSAQDSTRPGGSYPG